MVFIGEDEHFCRNSSQFGCVERRHTLRGKNAEVIFSVSDEYGGVPLVYEFMRRCSERTLCRGILFIPRSSAHIPVGKPHFFGFYILLFEVIDTCVGDKCFESFLVMSGQPIDRESSVAGANCAHVVAVDERFFFHFIGRTEIVFHVLATVVSADLFEPFLTESIETPTVGCDNDVSVGSH